MRRFFLGMAAKYSVQRRTLAHILTHGRRQDIQHLEQYLGRHYGGTAYACKNGRSALALALKAYFGQGDKIIVNGFTCYAVYEAIRAARLTPVFVDIDPADLNFDYEKLEQAVQQSGVKGIIVQNSLGHPVDVTLIQRLAAKYHLLIIEDLAHSAGIHYPDGREAGTVGAATALSFGKDKSIDTVSGGAVILRDEPRHSFTPPARRARISDTLRARFYPLFGAICRGLTGVHLGGFLMRGLVRLHLVEKSADSHLDFTRQISRFEARLALIQLRKLKKSGEPPIRTFYLVRERDKVLNTLKLAGYYFDGLWYKRPVAPERYYRRVHFPEADCPQAVFIASHIINFPTYYPKRDLERARQIITPYIIDNQQSQTNTDNATNTRKRGKND